MLGVRTGYELLGDAEDERLDMEAGREVNNLFFCNFMLRYQAVSQAKRLEQGTNVRILSRE